MIIEVDTDWTLCFFLPSICRSIYHYEGSSGVLWAASFGFWSVLVDFPDPLEPKVP